MEMYTFRNRETPLALIIGNKDLPVLNIYGESGIGKTCLLEEAVNEIIRQTPKALILKVDFSVLEFVENPDPKKEKFLEALVSQGEVAFGQVLAKKVDLAIGQIVASLLLGSQNVYFIFDTTEKIQEDTSFWAWLEEYFIGPLIVHGDEKVKLIFAGKMPAPFQRHEVRRALKLCRLEPLDVNTEARLLIAEILKKGNPQLSSPEQKKAEDFIISFSFGHPGLSVELAQYLTKKIPFKISTALEKEVCDTVIHKYIKETLLSGIEGEWVKILELASILDWFDPYILRKFTEELLPEVAANKSEAFYMQGIAMMRRKKSVIWSEQQGDRLNGVIREIIRRDIQVESDYSREGNNQFRMANTTAAGIIEDLKKQAVEAGESDVQIYDQQIQTYNHRAEGVGSNE